MEANGSLKDFQILRKLGEGAFGQVFMVKRKQDGQIYAMKKVKIGTMKDKEKDNALNQIRILASLNNQYIVKFKQAFFDSGSNCLCIVMEYAGGGDVLKKINTHIKSRSRISQQEIWKALLHITKGLKLLHQSKILHRDLKSANIFIAQDGTYKLGDLNVSKVLKKGLAHTQTGTPYYASPQVWQDQPYDMKSDMWSLGCVIYEMAALQPPFKASDLQSLYKKVKAGNYRQISTYYSSQLAQTISLLLKVKPKDRPDTEGLLKNPMLKKKCGIKLGNNELQNYFDSQNDPLLKTIKYNPFNLNSIKDKLPKSSYNEEKMNEKSRSRERRDSLDNLNYQKRERVLSACGMRNDSRGDVSPSHKKQQNKYTPVMPRHQMGGMGLPPKPSRKEDNSYKEPINRLRRVGQDIVSRGSQRSSSVNR